MQLLQIGKNPHFSFCMAYNALHLRVSCIASHQQKCMIFVCFHGNFMDFCNKRAGGIVIRQAACAYFVVDSLRHAMAADDDLVPVGHAGYIGAGQCAFSFQILDHLRVVDQRAKGRHLVAVGQ